MMFTHAFPSSIATKFLPLKTISYALQSRLNWHVYCVVAAFGASPAADCCPILFLRLKALRSTIIDRENSSIKSTDRSHSAIDSHTLYDCHDRLLEHKTALFDHLVGRWRDLFNLSFDVLLYDLTSTYFEIVPPLDDEGKRQFGYSRDHRPDCVQVVIALIITPQGFPLAYEVLAGNTADNTTDIRFLFVHAMSLAIDAVAGPLQSLQAVGHPVLDRRFIGQEFDRRCLCVVAVIQLVLNRPKSAHEQRLKLRAGRGCVLPFGLKPIRVLSLPWRPLGILKRTAFCEFAQPPRRNWEPASFA
jgi:hypothetical protein